MTTAQALTSASYVSSPGQAPAGDATSNEPGRSSFGDTLDSAMRESEGGSGRFLGASAGSREKSSADGDGKERRDDAASGEGEPVGGASGLSTILAALAAVQEGKIDFDTFLKQAQQNAPGEPAVPAHGAVTLPSEGGEGPLLPGAVTDGQDALDAERLLQLLKSEQVSSADPVMTEEVVPVTVKGQETHLALAGRSPEVLGALAEQMGNGASSSNKANGLGDNELLLERRANAAAADGADGAVQGDPAKRVAAMGGAGSNGDGAFLSDSDGQRDIGRGAGARSDIAGEQSGTNVFASALSAARAQGAAGSGPVDGAEGSFPSVSEQIAAEVRAELRSEGVGETSSDGVVKVLHLELKPANLGAVTVRLALKDNMVSVHIEAQRGETVAMLERDREALSDALSQAGYSVDGITAAQQSDTRFGGSQSNLNGQSSGSAFGSAAGQAAPDQGTGQGSGSFSGQGGSGQSSAGRSGSDVHANGGRSAQQAADGLYV